MRLDHIAYRCFDKVKTTKFFMDAFGYTFQAEFDIFFNDEKTDVARCIALEPPEKTVKGMSFTIEAGGDMVHDQIYHMAPELFISEGSEGSIVHNWCVKNGNKPGIHHMAYQVDSVEAKMNEWIKKGYAEFTSDQPMKCGTNEDQLIQIFTKPSELTGVIFEFIERTGHGFCKDNVRQLMLSTVKLDGNIK